MAVGQPLQRLLRDRTFAAGDLQPAHQLRAVVRLAALVALDHLKRDLLDLLVAGETALAPGALTPPANDVRLTAFARVDDAVFRVAAERASHRQRRISRLRSACRPPHPRPACLRSRQRRPSRAKSVTPVTTTGTAPTRCSSSASGDGAVDVESVERRQRPLTDLVESADAARRRDGDADRGHAADEEGGVVRQRMVHGDEDEPVLRGEAEPDRRPWRR